MPSRMVRHGVSLLKQSIDVSYLSEMDEPAAVAGHCRERIGRRRAGRWGLVLSHAQVRPGGISTDPAGALFPRDACRPIGGRLPLLS